MWPLLHRKMCVLAAGRYLAREMAIRKDDYHYDQAVTEQPRVADQPIPWTSWALKAYRDSREEREEIPYTLPVSMR